MWSVYKHLKSGLTDNLKTKKYSNIFYKRFHGQHPWVVFLKLCNKKAAITGLHSTRTHKNGWKLTLVEYWNNSIPERVLSPTFFFIIIFLWKQQIFPHEIQGWKHSVLNHQKSVCVFIASPCNRIIQLEMKAYFAFIYISVSELIFQMKNLCLSLEVELNIIDEENRSEKEVCKAFSKIFIFSNPNEALL